MQGKPIELLHVICGLDKDKIYEIKEIVQKRSLTQNAYAWQLINKIGNALSKSKEEVYFDMLRHYGQSTMVSILSTIDLNGYMKHFEVIGTSLLNDKEFKHVKCYKGSSEYNTKEMQIFINGVVQEATNLQIPTLTPNEIARLRL